MRENFQAKTASTAFWVSVYSYKKISMKLRRYGPVGQEKPGVLDAQDSVRDLSAVVPDLAGDALLPARLARLKALDIGGQLALRLSTCC